MFPAAVLGRQREGLLMAVVNDSIYTTDSTLDGITFTKTVKQLTDSKHINLNTQYDFTICPWKIDIQAKCYNVKSSKLVEVYKHKLDKIIFQSNNSWQNLTSYISAKNNYISKNDVAGNGFANWSPDMGYNSTYYSSAFSTKLISNMDYKTYCGLIYVFASDGFQANGFFNTPRLFTLKSYRNNATRYKYVIAVFLRQYWGPSGRRADAHNYIAHSGIGSQSFNFTTDVFTENFSKKYDSMLDTLGRMHLSGYESQLSGIPVLGTFDEYGFAVSSVNVLNISSATTASYTDIVNHEVYCNNLTVQSKDLTALSNPEKLYHDVLFWFEISPDEILKQCLKYGVIVCESEESAKDGSNTGIDCHIPIIKGGSVTSDFTSGSGNSSNPNMQWENPWSSAGYDPSDPNSYTDKIELSKPGLTTTGIFNRTFALTATSVKNLADYLWNADESIFNEIVKGLSLMGGNPIDGLIDLRLYPFDVSAKAGGGNTKSIVVGRTDTKVNGLEINEYNAVLELGSCTFHEKFGNFLDYEPFTTASLYIPYVGIVPISTADFMGQTISCKMVVDITTGSCTAVVFANEIPIIYKNGNIGVEIPMTGTNSAEYASRIAGGLTSGATDVALGAASKSVGQVVSGVGSIADSALSVNNTMYNTAGSSSPACGLWQPQNCYFIIQRPVPIVPENYGHNVGYACNYQAKISECSGYTQTYNVDVSSINAPESEKNAIAEILNSGFYA